MDQWLAAHGVGRPDRDLCGYLASVLVLATFSMKSMRWLRIAAIGSNIAFIVYALTTHLQPILLLHSILLPLNVVRLTQIEMASKAKRRVENDMELQLFETSD
jgi:hypothetical protein